MSEFKKKRPAPELFVSAIPLKFNDPEEGSSKTFVLPYDGSLVSVNTDQTGEGEAELDILKNDELVASGLSSAKGTHLVNTVLSGLDKLKVKITKLSGVEKILAILNIKK